MTGDSRDFLRLYADTVNMQLSFVILPQIHNAHVLAGDLHFRDLRRAFDMTCDLQQHVVGLIYGHLINLEADIKMKSKGTVSVKNMNTDMDAQPNHDDQNQNSEVMGSENIENGEAINNNNHHLCEPSNQVVNNAVPPNSQMSSTCGTVTPSTSTSTQEEAWKRISNKHKLISIDFLFQYMLETGVTTTTTGLVSDTTECIACKLRKCVNYETGVTMVCAACPRFPRLCSAQCFRWWHNVHLPASGNKPGATIESNQTNTTIRKSNDQVMVSESQVSSEFRAPEESVLQTCTTPVCRVVRKRRRRKAARYGYGRRKVWSRRS
ncbi:unnamed protein product [Trichobilharzia szidati]|nr:unnamed protein product [Trichobilharzia szidati]